jgi:hypothetical protein
MPTRIWGGADNDWEYSSDGSTWHAIAQLEKADGPKSKRGKIDTPVLGAASLAKLPGELDTGTITLAIWLDITDSSHSALYDFYVNGDYFYLRNTGGNTKVSKYYGFATEWSESGFDNADGVKLDYTFECSGDRTNS